MKHRWKQTNDNNKTEQAWMRMIKAYEARNTSFHRLLCAFRKW